MGSLVLQEQKPAKEFTQINVNGVMQPQVDQLLNLTDSVVC
ncbi:hypothetical protein [Endozoicomonas sp. GU-1]|nr:hypothetical protein [Endozoicomonas sp. GU-1]WBA84130.1 hypothetical protein O2T12_01945 [Endozoicomonas sp. GU-1]